MLAVLQGVPNLISRARLNRLLPDPAVRIVDLPAIPAPDSTIFEVDQQRITWADMLQIPVRLGEGGVHGYRPHHRLARLLLARSFRWLIREDSVIRPQTQIMELSRQGYRDILGTEVSGVSPTPPHR